MRQTKYIVVMPSGRSKKFTIARSAVGSARYQSIAECMSMDTADAIVASLNNAVDAPEHQEQAVRQTSNTKGGRKAA